MSLPSEFLKLLVSRSLLRSRVDLYESADEYGKKTVLPESPKAEFDEFAMPTPKQLLSASSLSVISDTGVRVRFGDIWEKQKTVVIFTRHFRFVIFFHSDGTGCQRIADDGKQGDCVSRLRALHRI